MLLSIITVAFRNLEGIVKTHASLAHLAQADDISFEWIVVDGGSNDGTREYLENLNGIFNLRFVSEPDNGIYDAMNNCDGRRQVRVVSQFGRYFSSECRKFCP